MTRPTGDPSFVQGWETCEVRIVEIVRRNFQDYWDCAKGYPVDMTDQQLRERILREIEGGGQRPEAGASESELNGQVSRSNPSPERPRGITNTMARHGGMRLKDVTTSWPQAELNAQPERDLVWTETVDEISKAYDGMGNKEWTVEGAYERVNAALTSLGMQICRIPPAITQRSGMSINNAQPKWQHDAVSDELVMKVRLGPTSAARELAALRTDLVKLMEENKLLNDIITEDQADAQSYLRELHQIGNHLASNEYMPSSAESCHEAADELAALRDSVKYWKRQRNTEREDV